MKRIWPLVALLCLPAITGLARGADATVVESTVARATQDCPPSAGLTLHGPGFDRLTAALATEPGIDVLAIGSTAMLGPAGLPRDAFTYRAIDLLTASRPDAKISVVARNARGALAADMLATLRTELATHQFQLVFWQAGAVEALRAVPLPEFRQTLAEGARLVTEAHGSLVLIDTQFSRLMHSKVDVAPYEQIMREIASTPGVALFPRYDLTRDWVASGRIDLEQATQGDRQKVADHLNECLGAALATAIGQDVGRTSTAK